VSVALSVLTLCALAWSAPPAFAQASFSKITDFPAIDGYAAYNTPVQGPDGAFYGATYYGGTAGCNCGTIYRIDQYGVETMIHSFAGGSSDGANPEFNRLALAGDGNFYGTTVSGGANNQGTIFRISPSGTYAMIFSFNNSASPSTGYQPFGGLVLGPDGKLWGAATNGGAGGAGTIFNITTGGVFTVAHQLAGYNGTTYPDGANSYGGLAVGSDGLLYGTTWNYGANPIGQGTFFRINPSTNVFSVLHTFAQNDGTKYPEGRQGYSAPAQGSDGRMYVARMYGGGPQDYGAIDAIDPSSLTFSVVHVIAAYNGTIYPDGYYLFGGLVLASDGKLYGETYNGGAYGNGILYSLATDGTFTDIHDVHNAVGEGGSGYAGLSQLSSGALVGTNVGGGGSGNGELFTVNTDGSSWTDLHDWYSTPAQPLESVIRASDGNLYGTSVGGSGCGTAFRIEPDNSIQILHVFTCSDPTDGTYPYGRLVEAPDGNLYGTTYQGGANNYGTVYKLTKLGQFTLLHSFSAYNAGCNCYPDGLYPYSGVIAATDGNLYGTTNSYGHYGAGTIYQITTGGTFSVIHDINNASPGYEGVNTYEGGVVQGPDGRLYGTTYGGGTHGYGTLFAVTLAGTYTKLYDFDYGTLGDGYQSHAPLVFDAAGNLYGTTLYGGYDNVGTVFTWHKAGGYAVLKHFYQDEDGCYPYGGVTIGQSGALYGTASQCGTRPVFGDQGVFFTMSTDGSTFQNLFNFNSAAGSASGTMYQPRSTPFEDTPGNFIGSTYYGGGSGRGGVYEISLFAVKVTSPNGGETMYDDTPYTITWNATGGAGGINHFDVALSIDGGVTWRPTLVCSGVAGSARSCVFSTPGPTTSKGRIKVTALDNGGHSLFGISAANFAIKTGTTTSAKLKVMTPAANVNVGIGTHQSITWSHDLGTTETFNIDLSVDNGGHWTSVATGVPASSATAGKYTWLVPNMPSTTAFIRVSAVNDAISAESGLGTTPFTIAAPFITVSPNTIWHDGAAQAIKWTSNLGALEKVSIALSLTSGDGFPVVVDANTPSDGTDTKTVQSAWNTGTALLKISWVANTSVNGVSAKTFVIEP